MTSTVILSDNGASSGSAGLKSTAGNDGVLILQTTTVGGTATNAVYIDTSQNVGIGTSSPSTMLQLNGSAAAGKDPTITLNNTTASTGRNYQIISGDGGPFRIQDATAGAERMRIDSSGNVGIGTSSPSVRLHVAGSGISNPSGGTGAYVNTLIYDTATGGGTGAGGGIGFQGNDGTNSGVVFAAINGSKENSTSGNYASYLSFSTRANGGNITERARIDSSGNLLVGTTSLGFATTRSASIRPQYGDIIVSHANGDTSGNPYLQFGYNGGGIGTITQNGTTAVAYNTTSDYRLKENIQPITNALSRIAALKPCTYTWKKAPEETGEGFIAHELAEVCPHAVSGEKDAVDADGNPVYQGIDTSFLVATLTAAIQEQQAIIEALRADVEQLKGKA